MQHFEIELRQPIDSNTEMRFRHEWEQQIQMNLGPSVYFQFEGTRVKAELLTSPGKEWAQANFQQAFKLILHKVDAQSEVKKINSELELRSRRPNEIST